MDRHRAAGDRRSQEIRVINKNDSLLNSAGKIHSKNLKGAKQFLCIVLME